MCFSRLEYIITRFGTYVCLYIHRNNYGSLPLRFGVENWEGRLLFYIFLNCFKILL